MRSWLTYTAARLGLFAGAFGVVYLFGARSWIALVLAWVISGLVSYVLLSKLRDQLSANTVERLEARRRAGVANRLSAGAAREDEIQESAGPATEGAEGAGGAGGSESGASGDGAAEKQERERDEDTSAPVKDS